MRQDFRHALQQRLGKHVLRFPIFHLHYDNPFRMGRRSHHFRLQCDGGGYKDQPLRGFLFLFPPAATSPA